MWKYSLLGPKIARSRSRLCFVHRSRGCKGAHAQALLTLCLALLAGCSQYPSGGNVRLHLDMVDQPTYRPQNDPRALPAGTVPTVGWDRATTQQAAELLPNPTPATAATLQRGAALYGIYCTPCHGSGARGDGQVAAKMVKPADLAEGKYRADRDGFFYYVIRSGSGLMPPFYESLSAEERWAIVRHIRKLQTP